MGNAGQANYAASKAGLIGLTKSLARELGSRNITVNAIAPGYIQTPMTEKLTEEQRKALMVNLAIPRLGTPEDIANVVIFLAGPAAVVRQRRGDQRLRRAVHVSGAPRTCSPRRTPRGRRPRTMFARCWARC